MLSGGARATRGRRPLKHDVRGSSGNVWHRAALGTEVCHSGGGSGPRRSVRCAQGPRRLARHAVARDPVRPGVTADWPWGRIGFLSILGDSNRRGCGLTAARAPSAASPRLGTAELRCRAGGRRHPELLQASPTAWWRGSTTWSAPSRSKPMGSMTATTRLPQAQDPSDLREA